MPAELDQNFSELEKKIQKMANRLKDMKESVNHLAEQNAELKKELYEERKKSQELAEEHKKIKLYSAVSGNPEHNRLMKNHINRLIKEVDFCIAQLQNTGL